MNHIELKDLTHERTLTGVEMRSISGGITHSLQQQINQFGANLNARAQVLFNPYYQWNIIRASQQAWRIQYGRQMPWNFQPYWM